jgi:hypothetical protein
LRTKVECDMSENALYEMEKVTGNPKYEGFAFVRKESIRGKEFNGRSSIVWDFGSDDVKTKGRGWTVPRLASIWTSQPVIGRVRSFNDYPCVALTIPAFSRRAVDALIDFLKPNGELLPLTATGVGEYFAYNTTTVVDVLDQQKSKFEWLSTKHTVDQVFQVRRYECVPSKMAGLSIFRIVEMPSSTYVSQAFVDRVKEQQLNGFHFIKLWPLPKDVSWQDLDRKERKKMVQVKTKGGVLPIKGNTVVLRFPIAKAKPSKAEKDRLAKVMDEIDGLLYDRAAKRDAPLLGSLEGDDIVEGELRLFLSCPDADVLVEKLRPWLTSLSWADVKVLYGELADANCPEEYVEL